MDNLKKYFVLKILLALFPTAIFVQNLVWLTSNKPMGIGFFILWFLMVWNVADFSEKDEIFERYFRLTEIAFFLMPVSTIVMTFILGNEALLSSSNEFEAAGAAIGTAIGGALVVGMAFVIGLALGVIMHLVANKYSKKIEKNYKSLGGKHGIIFSLLVLFILAIVINITSNLNSSTNSTVGTNIKTRQTKQQLENLTNKVGIEVTKKEFVEGSFQSGTNIEILFTNKTDKDIKGVEGVISFFDIFDNKIKDVVVSYSDGILANQVVAWEGGVYYNEFIDEDVKFRDAPLENMRVEWKVTSIVYSDEVKIGLIEASQLPEVGLEILSKDFRSADWQDYIIFRLKLKNNTAKDIKGFQGNITFYDIFNNKIFVLTIPYDEGIAAGVETEWDVSMDYNMFMDDHIKLKDTSLNNLKYEWNIDAIVYEDGAKEMP